MIDRNEALPISRQATLVGISRGNVYYLPRGVTLAKSGDCRSARSLVSLATQSGVRQACGKCFERRELHQRPRLVDGSVQGRGGGEATEDETGIVT